ncbi:MAG: transglutaminase domain-containing protein [Clostridia bacterium]|nr:transglutaminase domain-containing protein [Clostridia bacterium]
MKKIILILVISSLLVIPVYGDNQWQKIGETETFIVDQDPLGIMFLTFTKQAYFLNVLDMTVNVIEANVVINGTGINYEHIKVVIEKDEKEYIYNLLKDIETFPLQMGSGIYKISILGSTDGRRYRQLSTKNFDLTLEENAVFLSQSQTVNWNIESESTILAQVLTENDETPIDKLNSIHDYVVHNISYDYEKAATLSNLYVPNPDDTLLDGKGICYDFAALLASMLRSVEVPSKLIKGYSTFTPVYHAWNEILIDDEWYIVDSSTDSIFVAYNVPYKLRKDVRDYQTSKEY